MILSDRSIREAMVEGRIGIDPLEDDQIQPASVDVRLGNRIMVMRDDLIRHASPFDPGRGEVGGGEHDYKTIDLSDDAALPSSYVLRPGTFILAATMECITLDDQTVAMLEGKSSLGRLGVVIHQTAGLIDPGWNGRITLEISNVAQRAVRLRPGMKIGQLTFTATSTRVARAYGHPELGSRYQGDMEVGPSLGVSSAVRT